MLEARSFNGSRVEFEIVDEIRAEFDHCAQILAVRIFQGPHELLKKLGDRSIVAAKFYDPLYWDHAESTADPFYCVTRHYTHEVATYDKFKEQSCLFSMTRILLSCRLNIHQQKLAAFGLFLWSVSMLLRCENLTQKTSLDRNSNV